MSAVVQPVQHKTLSSTALPNRITDTIKVTFDKYTEDPAVVDGNSKVRAVFTSACVPDLWSLD